MAQQSPAILPVLGGTAVAMAAFAANSLFCRLALGRAEMDAASFTAIRLGAGALVLGMVCALHGSGGKALLRPDWPMVLALFGYAAAFSLAYRDLTAGTGALLLFGAVQVTMIGTGLVRGERPTITEWGGLLVALAGLGWLVAPGLAAPPPRAAILMIAAGTAWGVYSLRGRRAGAPLAVTATNFLWSVPLGLAWLAMVERHVSVPGVISAVLSGAVASGAGYAVWYTVLPRLTATRAATVQLTVPILAALGGVAFLGEKLSLRLLGASALVLGGVGLAIAARRR
jgi:drug/metabolite transporter (DMT)-like permease